MIPSKDIFASQRLNCSLHFFFLLGILLKNSVLAASEVVSFGVALFVNFFEDLKMSQGLLECFDLLSSVYNTDIA